MLLMAAVHMLRRFPVAALYTINTALALVSLTGLNLPMYTAIKRLTPMTVLVIKAAWKRRWPPARLTASVGLVVVGCVVAGLGDLAFDAAAYSFALASVVVQAGYLLLVEAQVCGGVMWCDVARGLAWHTCGGFWPSPLLIAGVAQSRH